MSSLIKGPLDGAAAVRELTGADRTELGEQAARLADERAQQGLPDYRYRPGERHALPTVADVEPIAAAMTADVEHDGDRGPRAFRDPLSVLDRAADAQRAAHIGALLSAVAGLHVDEVAALAWVAGELPGVKLRRRCEEATATGWCRTEDPKPTARSTPEDRARAALLAAWRQVVALVHGARSSAAEDLRQRTREDVLADEAARRAGGGR